MTFDTWSDAEDAYYAHHQCDSDDADKEQARVERWVESEGHVVLEDNPDAHPEPVDGATKRRREWVRSLQNGRWTPFIFGAVIGLIIDIIIWTSK